ncbi:hypothetical protein KC19_10G019100 [Ceratodon purpureus]|uniref:Uncharacterized protein n=1 Tax=Ceratodon purpureus TaxID=3225 RepID=A0A8T0GH19_CERPU|nr:hypothetical protein KC19_10G019100 [Ceratodon purpureus]
MSFGYTRMGGNEFDNGNSKSATSPDILGTRWSCSPGCMFCNLASTLDDVLEWFPRKWSWWEIILDRVIKGIPYPKPWELWWQLWSWLTSEQSAKKEISYVKETTRAVGDCSERDSSHSVHIDELNLENVSLTTPYFFISDGVWHCAGFDSSLQKWRRLPPLNYLPAYCKPDHDLFKEYLVCTQGGIICMNVSKSTEDKIIVCNVLTREWRELPPLNHRRNPVLMHLVVDALTQSYQVVVAGSSGSGDGRLSRMTEVFDSRTWKWTRTGDLPGPEYALNGYQSGVHKDGYLYCIAFLDQHTGRGILRYNLNEGNWLKNCAYPIPFSTNSTILQLVQCGGEMYLFSERENENYVEHCIDRVDWVKSEGVFWSLNNVVRSENIGVRSLEVYPEHTCSPYSNDQLCVFNTIDHSGVVYNVRNHGQPEVLPAPPATGFSGENFFSLNPMSFMIKPSFRSLQNLEQRH